MRRREDNGSRADATAACGEGGKTRSLAWLDEGDGCGEGVGTVVRQDGSMRGGRRAIREKGRNDDG